MKLTKLLNFYIAKIFLVKFFQILFGFSLLIFFINLLDAIEKVKDVEVPFTSVIAMAFLQIPDFLNEVVASLVLIAGIITFFLLSSRSEITILRISGFSLWQVSRPVAISAMLLGVFWVTIFGPISIAMIKKFNALEGKYVRDEIREVVAPRSGIWLKQANSKNPEEEIIIQAEKVYKEDIELDEVTIWFFDKNGHFYKKIDAREMYLKNNFWHLYEVTLNDSTNLNKRIDELKIPTDLKANFVLEKIVNNFENAKLFSIFSLPNLIKDLQSAGFSSIKFKIYLHSLLNKPFLFLAMTLISCYFGINHVRNQNAIFMIFLGISCGLILYVTSSIISALGTSGLIPIFAATWVTTIIFLAIGTLLIYRKENL